MSIAFYMQKEAPKISSFATANTSKFVFFLIDGFNIAA